MPAQHQPQTQPPQIPTPQPTFNPLPMNNITHNMNTMSLQTPPQLNHANSNPDLYQQSGQQMSILHPLQHSASVPNQMNNMSGQNRIPGHALGTMTPPPSNNVSPPSFTPPRCGSATPPTTNNPNQYNSYSPNRKLSVPTIPFASSIFEQDSTPNMLQSSHLSNKQPQANSATPVNPASMNNMNGHVPAQLGHSSFYNPVPQATPQLTSPTQPAANSFPLVDQMNGNSGYGKVSPVANTIAPPTTGYYARRISNGNSPSHSGHNSPVPPLDPSLLENDQDVLQSTLNKLNDCRQKCSCSISAKVSDDINKKIKVFENAWTAGKLTVPVKGKMVQFTDGM